MIQNDLELETTQERILLFERVLAEARKNYLPQNYRAMAEGYLAEIELMQTEIRSYLKDIPEHAEAA